MSGSPARIGWPDWRRVQGKRRFRRRYTPSRWRTAGQAARSVTASPATSAVYSALFPLIVQHGRRYKPTARCIPTPVGLRRPSDRDLDHSRGHPRRRYRRRAHPAVLHRLPAPGLGLVHPGLDAPPRIRMSILAVAPGRPVAGQAGSINVEGVPRRSHTRAFTPSRRAVRGLRQAGHRLPWPARPGPSPPWGSPALPPDRRSKLPGFRDSRPRAESTMGAPARTANTIEGGRGKRVGLGHRPPDEK